MESFEAVAERIREKVEARTESTEVGGQPDTPVSEPPTPVCRHCGGPAEKDYSFSFTVGHWRYETSKLPDECLACARERAIASELERQEADRRKNAQEWRERSNLGRRLEAALEGYQVTDANRQAHAKVQAWLETRTDNLIIVGPIGSGKSFLAAHAFLRLHERFESAWWLSVPRLFETIKASYEGHRGDADAFMRWAKTAPFLFLDDLGKTHSQNVSWIEEQLYAIVDVRYSEELPTIVTTEYSGAALRSRVGESVVSRLEHGAMVAGIKKPAKTWRQLKATS